MAKLTAVRLSANPTAIVTNNAEGINGKVNMSTGGKPYVQLVIEEKGFGRSKKDVRTYWGNVDGTFRGFTPKEMKAEFEGKSLDEYGKFVTKTTMPYTFKGDDGVERSVSSKTLFVFSHENADTVFTAAGYTVTAIDEETGDITIVASPKERSENLSGANA